MKTTQYPSPLMVCTWAGLQLFHDCGRGGENEAKCWPFLAPLLHVYNVFFFCLLEHLIFFCGQYSFLVPTEALYISWVLREALHVHASSPGFVIQHAHLML